MCHPLVIVVLVYRVALRSSGPLWGLNPPLCYRWGASVALLSRTAAGAAPDGIFNGADAEDEFLQGFLRHLTAYCFLLFAPLPPHAATHSFPSGSRHARLFSSSVCGDADNYCVSFFIIIYLWLLWEAGEILIQENAATGSHGDVTSIYKHLAPIFNTNYSQ